MGNDTLKEDQLNLFTDEVFFNTDKELRNCITCKRDLPLNCYGNKSIRLDGTTRLYTQCKECVKKDYKIRSYLKRITPEPPEDYVCPICLSKKGEFHEQTNYSGRLRNNHAVWALDHDHDTGEFKGWLCNKCNSALGWLSDDIDNVRRALNYLEKFENNN
tara:strand:+ start:106 stop:585 length:480 start_codon:yes stop_codon:yes gene_type:complete